ncbi:MAG: hypothetical protein QGI21_06850 [Candidatus Poseidoniaceae archaeon]|jgi:hypothetical protein|nr:hypothetical protein [Candidatus Poseidoniaceae archaeon]
MREWDDENSNKQRLAVSGLQKLYMRTWDDAQEAIDAIADCEQIPILCELKAVFNHAQSTIDALIQSDCTLGVISFSNEIEQLSEFMNELGELITQPRFSTSVNAALIVAASQSKGSPTLPVFAGYSLHSTKHKPTLDLPGSLVDNNGFLMVKHEATARSMLKDKKIPSDLHDSLPSVDESKMMWGREE